MIPRNDTNQEQIAQQNAKQFRTEVDMVENYIFSQKWEVATCSVPEHIWAGWVREFQAGNISFTLTDEHWKAIVADIQDAGYHVYRKWYHNGYYGTTRIFDHCITKAPLTAAQRVNMHLQDDWSTPSGPGREQMRGELL